MNSAGVCGGRIAKSLIRDRSLRLRSLRKKEAGVMEQWSVGFLRKCNLGIYQTGAIPPRLLG
jgi:hypothetical protein